MSVAHERRTRFTVVNIEVVVGELERVSDELISWNCDRGEATQQGDLDDGCRDGGAPSAGTADCRKTRGTPKV